MSQTKAQLVDAVDGSIVDADIVGLSSSKLSGALPAISGASLTNIDGGKVLKVHSVSSTTGQDITSSSFVDLTNMSITLTPAATSKCYVIAVINGYTEFPSTFHGTNTLQLLRDSTEIATAIRGIRLDNSMSINFLQNQSSLSIAILDTHGADGSTAITYKLRGKTSSGKMHINSNFGTQSNFSVYEVAPN